MASFTFSSVADVFPVGASVSAYLPAGNPQSRITGSAVATATVQSDGSLVFSGLADDTAYVAYDGSRYKSFRSAPLLGSGSEVNVKRYGATGLGLASDAAAIQAAFDAIPESGGTVYFPAGTYLVGATLNLPSDRPWKIRGDGQRTTKLKLAAGVNASPLKYVGVSPSTNPKGSGGFTNPDNMDYLSIVGMEIDGNLTGQTAGPSYGLDLQFADYFLIHDVLVTRCRTAGVRLLGCDEGVIAKSFFASNGNAIGAPSISLDSGTHDVVMTGLGIESGAGPAILFNGAFECQVVGCNTWKNYSDISMQVSGSIHCTDNTIMGNVFEDALSTSIVAEGSFHTIIGNRILDLVDGGTDGIKLPGVTDCTIVGNTVGTCSKGITESGAADRNLIAQNNLSGATTPLTVVGASTWAMQNRGVAPAAVTGSRGGNAALASMLTKLAGMGLITDSTTA